MLKTSSDIDRLNQQLEDHFGRFENNQAKWRLVWSEDQFETRYGTFAKVSEHGIYLGEETGFRRVPKYRQYLPHQWVLERLMPVPDGSDLTVKLSYEPVWGFGQLSPDWEAIKVLIDQVHELAYQVVRGKKKYPHPEHMMQSKEGIAERVNAYERLLFEGNNDELSLALSRKEAVSLANLEVPKEQVE